MTASAAARPNRPPYWRAGLWMSWAAAVAIQFTTMNAPRMSSHVALPDTKS